MKILHLSDLHLNRTWLEWSKVQAPHYDLVCVSGDLLDMFSRQVPLYGMVVIKEWADEFPGRLALCSGNHDGNDPVMTPPAHLLPRLGVKDRRHAEKLMLQERWMDALARAAVVTDGRSELLSIGEKRVVVTTIPYDFTAVRWHEELWRTGAQLRRESGAPWIVLHHEPPAGTKVGGPFGNSGLPYLVEEYQPNFLLSGHIHLQPYRGDFAERLGATWCFNPGVPDGLAAAAAEVPNHIVLDLSERAAVWHATATSGQMPIRRLQHMR
jgi:Icc-related predicted phosphoesterase